MEMASYLAGERWSDHPSCTQPLLAGLARVVNDHTTDEGRSGLIELIPSVIGLTSDDPRVDVRIALRCARSRRCRSPPPSASGVLAVSILAAERALIDLDGSVDAADRGARRPTPWPPCPTPPRWARAFTDEVRNSTRGFGRHAAPSTVRYAGRGHRPGVHPRPRRPAPRSAGQRDRRQRTR